MVACLQTGYDRSPDVNFGRGKREEMKRGFDIWSRCVCWDLIHHRCVWQLTERARLSADQQFDLLQLLSLGVIRLHQTVQYVTFLIGGSVSACTCVCLCNEALGNCWLYIRRALMDQFRHAWKNNILFADSYQHRGCSMLMGSTALTSLI